MPGAIKLNKANICLDCEHIFDQGTACPVCASWTWVPLACWIPPLNPQSLTPLQGKLNRQCLKCHQSFVWQKVGFTRRDGYHDWRLYVSCRCGQAGDPEILRLAREQYDQQLKAKLGNMQRQALSAHLGRVVHDRLERIVHTHTPGRLARRI